MVFHGRYMMIYGVASEDPFQDSKPNTHSGQLPAIKLDLWLPELLAAVGTIFPRTDHLPRSPRDGVRGEDIVDVGLQDELALCQSSLPIRPMPNTNP